MPMRSKDQRRGAPEKNRRKRSPSTSRSSSFRHYRVTDAVETRIQRPKTLPELRCSKLEAADDVRLNFNKLLFNVMIQGSVGVVHILMPVTSTVDDLIANTLKQYSKEGRRPVISVDSSRFDLHYSQYSFQNLHREEKLVELGSRNFFLCTHSSELRTPSLNMPSSSCSKEVGSPTRTGFSWLKLKDFLF